MSSESVPLFSLSVAEIIPCSFAFPDISSEKKVPTKLIRILTLYSNKRLTFAT